MKLTADQIRERAKEIAWGHVHPERDVAAIIKLIEDDRGEKLPEPFDESKVTPWSVWESAHWRIVVLVPTRALIILTPSGNLETWRDGTRTGLIESLKALSYRYIGQFDLSAGLPNSK